MKIIDIAEEVLSYWLWALILIGIVYFTVIVIKAIYNFVKRKLHQQTREDLEKENEQLHKKIDELYGKINALESQVSQKDVQMPNANSQLINVGTLKIKSDNILYIVSQSVEQPVGGSSRIKVIHYVNSDKTDSVYSTFDSILEQLSGDFMLINKNQLVNLREIHKIQGYDLYLKNIKTPFIISETKKEELDIRAKNV